MLLYLHITVQGTYFTCIRFTTFFCTQTAKKLEDLRRYSSQVGLSEHDAVSLSSAQRHSILSFSLMLPALCWSIMHVLSLYRPLLELFLWTPAQVNDNLNPSEFISSHPVQVKFWLQEPQLCVCVWFYCGTKFSPRNDTNSTNLPVGTSS